MPYKVYKYCPRHADSVWIPKENASDIIQFRAISLLSVEVFFRTLANHLTMYLLRNAFIDTTVQNGGVPGTPGCIEQTIVLTQLICEARENRGDLGVVWLDIANVYGSIPHKFVATVMTRYHVPVTIKDYYNSFSLRFTFGTITSACHRVEKGSITGCTISETFFALAMNMLVMSAEVECRDPMSRSGMPQHPIRAFVDNLIVSASAVPGC